MEKWRLLMQMQKSLSGIVFENGYKVLENKGTAILGMSPGNGYFKKPIIYHLVDFAAKNFSQVHIWVPDLPAVHTYKALGYTDQEAQQKARLQGNNLKNHAVRAIQLLDSDAQQHCFISDWVHEIETNQIYQEKLAYVKKLYQTNAEFVQDAHSESARVIEGYSRRRQPVTPDSLNEATQYLLKEMAYFLACESILQSKSITLMYHRRWQVFEKFLSGHYDGNKTNIGLLIVEF